MMDLSNNGCVKCWQNLSMHIWATNPKLPSKLSMPIDKHNKHPIRDVFTFHIWICTHRKEVMVLPYLPLNPAPSRSYSQELPHTYLLQLHPFQCVDLALVILTLASGLRPSPGI